MRLTMDYPIIEGFALPSDCYYSIPEQYSQLQVKDRKYQITNWEWYQDKHPNIRLFSQTGPNTLAGVKEKGEAPIGIHITKGGVNWPSRRYMHYIPIESIEIKRVSYYRVLYDTISDSQRKPRIIIRELDDVAFFIGTGSYSLIKEVLND